MIRSTFVRFRALGRLLGGLLIYPAAGLAQESPPATPPAPALESPPAPSPGGDLGRQLEQLDERTRILERTLELQVEEKTKAKDTPAVRAGEKGFGLQSADGAFSVRIRGYVHADGRAFLGDDKLSNSDTFLLRRARPLLEATFFDVADFRLMPDFGNGQAVVQDAYGDLRPFTWLRLRVGKFKPPVGLERFQSATAIVFVERATPTSLVPNRDVGAQLHGDIAGGFLNYALGLFNGVADGGSGDLDAGFAKDIVGRLFLQPWKSDPHSALSGLGFGVGASTGDRKGKPAVLSVSGTTTTVTTASSPALPSYKSAGQQTVFSYLSNDKSSGTVLAWGRQTRLAPQAYYYLGALGLLGEYVRSSQKVVVGADSVTLSHSAWQIAATYLIGNGVNSFEGVQVKNPFDPKTGRLGVLELAARYNELRLDADAFPLYADPTKSIKVARGFAGAANWHWSRNVKLAVTYEETHFDAGATQADRKTERVLFTRLQTAF
jgi:phosphate-selective porin OprO and OprP